jgi:hypothetical protein
MKWGLGTTGNKVYSIQAFLLLTSTAITLVKLYLEGNPVSVR